MLLPCTSSCIYGKLKCVRVCLIALSLVNHFHCHNNQTVGRKTKKGKVERAAEGEVGG